jgi:hypothetical protein
MFTNMIGWYQALTGSFLKAAKKFAASGCR